MQPIHEIEPKKPLADAVRDVFERRARNGERKLIMETYQQKFEALLKTMPKEHQNTTMVRIQRELVKIEGAVHEYGARFADFIRKVFVWPMIAATENFPKDKYYQVELARASAWGEFAANTTKTATAERNAYRDNFLPTAIIGAESVGAVGTFIGASLGVVGGAKSGALAGASVGGIYGAGIGAIAGGVLGGATSLVMRLKDQIWGPPVKYYNLNTMFQAKGQSSIGYSGQ